MSEASYRRDAEMEGADRYVYVAPGWMAARAYPLWLADAGELATCLNCWSATETDYLNHRNQIAEEDARPVGHR